MPTPLRLRAAEGSRPTRQRSPHPRAGRRVRRPSCQTLDPRRGRSKEHSCEHRHHVARERLERVPVVRTFAERNVDPEDARIAKTLYHLARFARRAAYKSGHPSLVVAPVPLKELLVASNPPLVRAHVEAEVDGAHDRPGIAVLLDAPFIEHCAFPL